jgi:redox-sensitive bicupin YhaK (pirin superfamily)
MITKRPAQERGGGNHGWLDTRHTFSFSDYYDPEHIQFSVLRVINEDRVSPGQGFGTHSHRDMEIITYVLEGQLEHKDNLGYGAILRPREFQRITAGTGIQHSEFNPSKNEGVHFYQIWLLPDKQGYKPGYEQKPFPEEGRQGKLQLVASSDGRDGSLSIHQDAQIYLSSLNANEEVKHVLKPGRHGWLQVLRGGVQLNDTSLSSGDGAAISDETEFILKCTGPCEVMLFDLP